MKKCAFENIESEIRKEKAEALGRAGERLDRLLQDLHARRQVFLALVSAKRESIHDGGERVLPEIEEKLAEYARLRDQAKALRHFLIIQREAVGLSRHEDVDRQYPLPGPLTRLSATEGEADQ